MCLSRAYWSGIKQIYYAIKKENVPSSICYEGNLVHENILKTFNTEIYMQQIQELEEKAMPIVSKWLLENS